MLWIKVLNRKNHPFTHKVKIYGISIETILIASFIGIVLLLIVVPAKQSHKQKQTIHHAVSTR